MTTITSGSQILAAGVLWHSGAKNEKEARKRALDLTPTAGAKGPGRDFICLRSTTPVQFGISSVKTVGEAGAHQAGMTSAAASLADALPGSWAGIFTVPEGWYFVRTTLGIIAPRGDKLYRREEKGEAIAALLKAKDQVDALYAPASFELKNDKGELIAKERLIEEIITPVSRYAVMAPNKLRILKPAADIRKLPSFRPTGFPPRRMAVIGILVFAMGYTAYDRWSQPTFQANDTTPAWETSRSPGELAHVCTEALLGRPTLAGYKLHDGVCTPRGTTFTYSPWGREHSYLNAGVPAPQGCTEKKAVNGDIVASCTLTNGPAQGHQDLARGEKAQMLLDRHLTGLGLDVHYTPGNEQISPAREGVEAVTVPFFTVDIDGDFVPDTLAPDLAGLPGMTIQTVTFTPPLKWHVKGKLYYVR